VGDKTAHDKAHEKAIPLYNNETTFRDRFGRLQVANSAAVRAQKSKVLQKEPVPQKKLE
tara:strand:- start:666 stop:842 length:177 start_codon:yes stop_codon:yes gene_type:complete